MSKLFSSTSRKTQRGQGMSEYLIMVGVIAVAAVAVFGIFGDTVEQQMLQASAVLAGEDVTGGNITVDQSLDNDNDLNLQAL